MSADWITMLPLKVFTAIKRNFSETVKESYNMSDKNFSTVVSNDSPAVFPFVTVQMLPGNEIGQTFEANEIEAGMFTFQIDVFSNKTQTEARKVMNEIVQIMKKMGFRVAQIPYFNDTEDYHKMIARFNKSFSGEEAF